MGGSRRLWNYRLDQSIPGTVLSKGIAYCGGSIIYFIFAIGLSVIEYSPFQVLWFIYNIDLGFQCEFFCVDSWCLDTPNVFLCHTSLLASIIFY